MDYSDLVQQFKSCMFGLNMTPFQRMAINATRGEHFILAYLFLKDEPVTPSELSDMMSISTARVAATLNSLEKKGHISREINKDDRRQIHVNITLEGWKLAKQHNDEHDRNFEALLRELGEHDAVEMIRILRRIIEITQSVKAP